MSASESIQAEIEASREACCSSCSLACISNNSLPATIRVMIVPQYRLQLRGDGLASPKNSGTHRADGTAHSLGDVLVAHAFDFAQENRCTQILWQRLHGSIYRLAK